MNTRLSCLFHELVLGVSFLLETANKPFAQVTDGLVGESVEATSRDILLELFVPSGGVEAQKPIAERGQIAARELLDGVLNVKNGAHAGRIPLADFRASAATLNTPKLSDWRGT